MIPSQPEVPLQNQRLSQESNQGHLPCETIASTTILRGILHSAIHSSLSGIFILSIFFLSLLFNFQILSTRLFLSFHKLNNLPVSSTSIATTTSPLFRFLSYTSTYLSTFLLMISTDPLNSSWESGFTHSSLDSSTSIFLALSHFTLLVRDNLANNITLISIKHPKEDFCVMHGY